MLKKKKIIIIMIMIVIIMIMIMKLPKAPEIQDLVLYMNEYGELWEKKRDYFWGLGENGICLDREIERQRIEDGFLQEEEKNRGKIG